MLEGELTVIGCHGAALFEAIANVESDKRNTGLTYTNLSTRQTLVIISATTSAEEFLNTLTHEIHHVVSHICEAVGIDMASEEACYLTGTIARAAFHEAHTLLCDECRKAYDKA